MVDANKRGIEGVSAQPDGFRKLDNGLFMSCAQDPDGIQGSSARREVVGGGCSCCWGRRLIGGVSGPEWDKKGR